MRNVRIIPSKSDAHRALICAALSKTPCEIICSATSKDIEATKDCLQALADDKLEMHCGESGSTLRFLLPVMAALSHRAKFYPEGRLPERPLSPLYEELENHGCRLSPQGSVPLTIEGQLKPGDYHIPGNVSSQYISGLLFALPLLNGDSRILIEGNLESAGYVEMTLKTLQDFGIRVEPIETGYLVPGRQEYDGPPVYEVEGDWSNGCFWLAAGALREEGIKVSGLDINSLQGDKKIIDILRDMGAEVSVDTDGITIKGGSLRGITIDAAQIPDMVPILAVVAAAAEGTTEIINAGRLRIKESDRLATVAEVMHALGGQIEELSEGLCITGSKTLRGGRIDAHNDHRIVMMAAVASLISREKVIIDGSDAVQKSYPGFFQVMEDIGLDTNVERN